MIEIDEEKHDKDEIKEDIMKFSSIFHLNISITLVYFLSTIVPIFCFAYELCGTNTFRKLSNI